MTPYWLLTEFEQQFLPIMQLKSLSQSKACGDFAHEKYEIDNYELIFIK